MNTKLIMTLSALFMLVMGLIFSFLPQEISRYIGSTASTHLDVIIFQILSAMYLAFAMVNWTAKANLIGGIYSRPIAIGNLVHFAIGALALIKADAWRHDRMILAFAVLYILFAIGFGIVFFTHPVKTEK
jgi:hypothetical protein